MKNDKNKINSVIKFNAAVFLILVFFLLSCSSNPSEADGKKALKENYKNFIKIIKFRETNAQEGEFFGIKFYEMEYEAEIEYLDDIVMVRDFIGGGVNEIKKGKSRKDIMSILSIAVKKGTKQKIKGVFTFEHTKKGWRLS